MDTGLSPIVTPLSNGYDKSAYADETPILIREKGNTPTNSKYVVSIEGIYDTDSTTEGIEGREIVMLKPRAIYYSNENNKLNAYNDYKAKLKQKYKISFLSLPILAFIFYYSLTQFIGAIKTGVFFLHPLLSGGLVIASSFLVVIVIISAWQRDNLEAQIDQKIRSL